MQQRFQDEPTNHTDLDKYHELKAREFFQRFRDGKTIADFVTAENAFITGFLKGVDYGKATFHRTERTE